VRIAKHLPAEQRQMLSHLAFGIESTTGIVQVNLTPGIQTGILGGP
jgi:hypothetical protein